jgi:urease accessory protein
VNPAGADAGRRAPLAPGQDLADLRLLHLADSALPIGSLAHSLGLESLEAAGILQVSGLAEFFRGYLEEAGLVEAAFCRAAFRLANAGPEPFSSELWRGLNEQLAARKPARESRAASATLGHNFLLTVLALGEFPVLSEALAVAKRSPAVAIHHGPAFGLVSGALGFDEDRAVLAWLHQTIANLVSACQRLLPLGQTEAARILWNLKGTMIETAERSAACPLGDASCFMPLLDWGAMEHPALSTRLFVS